MRRAIRIAAQPVALQWMAGHVAVMLAIHIAVISVVQSSSHDGLRDACGIAWLVIGALMTGSASGGVAFAAWTKESGEHPSLAGCARAVHARAGRIAWESVRTGALVVFGTILFGVGALWAMGANCAVVPACVCERHLSPGDAAQSGYELVRFDQVRAFGMYALVTPVCLGGVFAAGVASAALRLLTTGHFRLLAIGLNGASLMGCACVYVVIGVATFVELRRAQPTASEIARTFE